MTAIQQFRKAVNYLETAQVHPILSPVQGTANIIRGIVETTIGVGMKCSGNPAYQKIQSVKHITRGTRVLKIGLQQIAPTAAFVGGVFLVSKYYAGLTVFFEKQSPLP